MVRRILGAEQVSGVAAELAKVLRWNDPGSALWEARNRIYNWRLSRTAFYRAYGFAGAIRLHQADARGAVSLEHGFFYNRIPKVANSTIVLALARACGFEARDADEAKAAFRRPSDLTADEVRAFEACFKFTVVRNPYSRVLSAYRNKIAGGKIKIASRDTSFTDFCRYLDNGNLFADAHWAPQSSLLLISLDEFDYVARFEDLHAGLSHVFSNLRLGMPDLGVHAGPAQTRASHDVRSEYNAECREIVSRLYRADFEAFGYPVT